LKAKYDLSFYNHFEKEKERTALVALVQNRSSFDDQIDPWQFPGTSVNMACYRLHKYLN